MKSLTHITTGTDEANNTYKQVRVQNFKGRNTKVTNTYYVNDTKVVKYKRWSAKEWINNNSYSCKTEEFKK